MSRFFVGKDFTTNSRMEAIKIREFVVYKPSHLILVHEDFNSLIIRELIFVPPSAEIEMLLLLGSATA